MPDIKTAVGNKTNLIVIVHRNNITSSVIIKGIVITRVLNTMIIMILRFQYRVFRINGQIRCSHVTKITETIFDYVNISDIRV